MGVHEEPAEHDASADFLASLRQYQRSPIEEGPAGTAGIGAAPAGMAGGRLAVPAWPAGGTAAGAAGGGLAGISGLTNEAGEYNCFLNTILQCLYRCKDFRQQVVLPSLLSCHCRPRCMPPPPSYGHAFHSEYSTAHPPPACRC